MRPIDPQAAEDHVARPWDPSWWPSGPCPAPATSGPLSCSIQVAHLHGEPSYRTLPPDPWIEGQSADPPTSDPMGNRGFTIARGGCSARGRGRWVCRRQPDSRSEMQTSPVFVRQRSKKQCKTASGAEGWKSRTTYVSTGGLHPTGHPRPSCRPSGHPNPGKRWIPKAAGRARRCSGEAASLLPRNTAEHRDPPCSPRWHRGSPPTSDESTPLRRGDVWVLLEGGSSERRPKSRHGAVGTNRSGDDRSHLRRGRYRHRPWSAPMGRRCCRCGAPDSRRFGVGLPPVGLRHPSRTTSPTKNSCDGRR